MILPCEIYSDSLFVINNVNVIKITTTTSIPPGAVVIVKKSFLLVIKFLKAQHLFSSNGWKRRNASTEGPRMFECNPN